MRLATRLATERTEAFPPQAIESDEPLVEKRLVCGRLTLQPESRRAEWNDRDVGLTDEGYGIVHRLASRVGRAAPRSALHRLMPDIHAAIDRTLGRIRDNSLACDPDFGEIDLPSAGGWCRGRLAE